MDFAASPTSTSAKEAVRLPTAVNPSPPREDLLQSHGVPLDLGADSPSTNLQQPKPPVTKHLSNPEYNSPLRHHRRTPSAPKYVKESLNARSEYVTSQDDGVAEHRINQYIIKQEIGRGSFGAVHLAVDQYGTEYAVKEFSKARLRKRAQSHILRQPFQQRRRGALQGFNSPLHRNVGQEGDTPINSIDLIKEEIAIMKKLNHPNLVSLIEVLDDPSEDSLYMVMEMCKKGVVMKVGLEERADPYPDHVCRCWFRDLILGIEYLHAQGVVHRDIKPDNCLITEDDVLKVVDFGVSEMFEKDSEMLTAKSAGSPAFLPPELCVARHGDVSGRAADIWSMGVTLYCLKYGRIPFEKSGIFELYEAIKTEEPDLSGERDKDLVDLMRKLLEKDPEKRITMKELREHAWVTRNGTDKLLSEKENTSNLVEPPTEAEMNEAITYNMTNIITVMKAVRKFKALLEKNRPPEMRSILGDHADTRFSQPPASMSRDQPTRLPPKSHSFHEFDGAHTGDLEEPEELQKAVSLLNVRPVPTLSIDDTTIMEEKSGKPGAEGAPPALASETSAETEDLPSRTQSPVDIDNLEPNQLPPFRSLKMHANTTDEIGHRGHAHDPLEDHLYLHIGPSTFSGVSSQADNGGSFVPDDDDDDAYFVSESPGAADVDIYETAYRDEIERIMAKAKEQNKEPDVYLTRRVDERLIAMSGLAGKWAAMGEEAKNQIKDYTQFSARKARVTEVSRALRHAAREEYERRKQERRKQIEAERAKPKAAALKGSTPPTGKEGDEPATDSPHYTSRQPGLWRGKAVDRSRQARTSMKGLMDMVKNKSRPKPKEEEESQ